MNLNDLSLIQDKINYQKSYLESNYFTTSTGQTKTLLDISFSANHSTRYYAQLLNKVKTLTAVSISQDLHSNFLTITIDGYFRDLITGDYSRFDLLSNEDLEIVKKSVPNSEVHGYIYNKILNRETLTIKDLYKILTHQARNFSKSYAFKILKKSGFKYVYERVVEPHKDGVPHLHMLLMIPLDFIDEFKKSFKNAFPAPRNSMLFKDLSKKELKEFDKKGIEYDLNDMVSFQTKVNDASGYILKYLLKTFIFVEKKKDINFLQAWYIKNKIIRFTTSRTLVPQWVYQKAYAFEQDWYHLTDLLLDSNNHCEWNKEDNYFYFIDNYTGRELIYSFGVYQLIYGDNVIKEIGESKEKQIKVEIYDKIPKSWNKKPLPPALVYFDKKLSGYSTKGDIFLFKDSISPAQMTDFQLYEYYNKLDIEICNPQHFGYVRNCMIDRNLLYEEKYNIDDYLDVSTF